MQEVLRKVEKLGASDSPVLILGETGTGKDVVARAIHAARPERPFVPIDCSAIVDTLLESELFGHTRGAFTGAVAAKPGLIEMAEGGTAFFDEIGELPLALQGKLLRAIQNKEIRPVGSLQPKQASFRILAATNRDLAREVERGHFRRDLYYRLNVVTLRLPPLRERKEDIPLLARHFLARHGGTHALGEAALPALMAHDWPGNIRELENAIERMAAMATGPVLDLNDLPTAVHTAILGNRADALNESYREAPPVIPLAEMERQAIVNALEHTKGNRAEAADLLGIGRTTLYRKIKEYRIAVPEPSPNPAAAVP